MLATVRIATVLTDKYTINFTHILTEYLTTDIM